MTEATAQRALHLTPASMIPTVRQRWLWEDLIPLGTVTAFAGRGGEGKSTLALHVAACANRGELPGDLHGTGVPTLIISHEDDWGRVMNPRLIAAGANLDHIVKLSIGMTIDAHTLDTVPMLPLDINLIRQAVDETGARLIIVDPISSTIDGDLYKLADVRRALDPLVMLAQELDIAIVAIMHFAKGTGHASDKIAGSHAFRDAVRSALIFATDEETGRRIITIDKGNYSEARGRSFAFNLRSVDVPTDDGATTSVAAVEWLGDSDVSVGDIINRAPDDEDRSESDEAADWLVGYLESQGGSAERADILKAAKAQHFSDKIIRRAREKAHVHTKRIGFPAKTVWSLAAVEPTGAQSRPSPENGHDWSRLGHDWTADAESVSA